MNDHKRKISRKARGAGSLLCLLGLGCNPGPAADAKDMGTLPSSRDDGRGEASADPAVDGGAIDVDATVQADPVVADAGMATAPNSPMPEAPSPVALNCDTATLPTRGILGRLTAGAGVTSDGNGVSSWQDQANSQRIATRQGGGPKLVGDALAGRPVLRFDGVDDVLHWPGFQLNGKTELTVAMVNATDFKAPGQEWCCSDDETGCSGTYHVPLFWNGTADWSGVMIAPVQEEVALRFGNGVKHYSDNFYDLFAFKVCAPNQQKCPGGIEIGSNGSCCGYGSCQVNWLRDPGVAYRRPASIGRKFTLSVTVKKPDEYELFVAGERVFSRPMPGGVREIKNVEDYARIGSAGPFAGRRWQGDIAEIVVYDHALDGTERTALETYLSCQYFPSKP